MRDVAQIYLGDTPNLYWKIHTQASEKQAYTKLKKMNQQDSTPNPTGDHASSPSHFLIPSLVLTSWQTSSACRRQDARQADRRSAVRERDGLTPVGQLRLERAPYGSGQQERRRWHACENAERGEILTPTPLPVGEYPGFPGKRDELSISCPHGNRDFPSISYGTFRLSSLSSRPLVSLFLAF